MKPPGTRTATPTVRRSNSTANLWLIKLCTPRVRGTACAGQRRASVTQVCFLGRPLTGSCRLGAKGPEQYWGVPALRALELCGAATWMERKARKLKVLSHVGTVAHWQV